MAHNTTGIVCDYTTVETDVEVGGVLYDYVISFDMDVVLTGEFLTVPEPFDFCSR